MNQRRSFFSYFEVNVRFYLGGQVLIQYILPLEGSCGMIMSILRFAGDISIIIYWVSFVLVCQLDMPDDHLCDNFQTLIDTVSALKSKALSKYLSHLSFFNTEHCCCQSCCESFNCPVTVMDQSGFTYPSPIPSTHLGIWACGSTWWRHTGKHGSSAPHQRVTQPTSWPHVASSTWSCTEQVARPATERFHPSDWRPLEACCRPWTWWCNDATALTGYATVMMMV